MDRTLVGVSNQCIEAYHIALRTIYGIEGEPDLQKHSGHTQPNIIRMICRDRGLPPDVIEARLAEAARVLSDTSIALLDDDLRSAALPGAVDLLDTLKQSGHALALVTGTVSTTARVVLERTGLQRYFPVCAFGDEGNERVDLLHLAVSRAVRTYGLESDHDDQSRLVVIGDAPRDIQAGKALGARVVSVATGCHTPDMLARHNPNVILPNLKDRQAALDAILGV